MKKRGCIRREREYKSGGSHVVTRNRRLDGTISLFILKKSYALCMCKSIFSFSFLFLCKSFGSLPSLAHQRRYYPVTLFR